MRKQAALMQDQLANQFNVHKKQINKSNQLSGQRAELVMSCSRKQAAQTHQPIQPFLLIILINNNNNK